MKGFGAHLQKSKFKKMTAKNHHELQHQILNISNQQLALMHQLADNKHKNSKIFLPGERQETNVPASALLSQGALAKYHRESLNGGGILDLAGLSFNKVVEYGGKGAKMLGKWALRNPSEAIGLGIGLVKEGKKLLTSKKTEDIDLSKLNVTKQEREAIDKLLVDSSDDEKKPGGNLRVRKKKQKDRWTI